MNLSENLKHIRKENNLSQEDLAFKLGVSRQAVSKWESGGAYPEMDKVLEICKLFNLNIDDLLNQNINKLNKENKKSKIDIGKYIDDFLEYITETINMFSSMSFKEKLKCILEQIIIISILSLGFTIIGDICSSAFNNITSFIPYKYSQFFSNILSSLYLMLCLVLTITIVFHIFKVRYLNYYTMIENDDKNNKENNSTCTEQKNINDEKVEIDNNKNFTNKIKEKIIIRDPNHSKYKFTNILIKFILICVKLFAIFMAISLCASLISLIIAITLSFMLTKSGILFIGMFITLLACIIINTVLLIILCKFIINQSLNKNRFLITFIIGIFMMGIGVGLIIISIKDFNIVDANYDDYITSEYTYKMTDKFFIYEDYNVNYIESNNNDIKFSIKHSKYYKVDFYDVDGKYINYYIYDLNTKIFDRIRTQIDNLNNKTIIDYSNYEINVYTSKTNIEKIKKNRDNYFNEINHYRESFEQKISELAEVINSQTEKIDSLEQIIENKDSEIIELKDKINDKNY